MFGAGVARAEETGDEVVFSVTRGLYDTAFDLELSTADEDARIYYTTDYSEPSESSGHLYTDPIRVMRTMTVKATGGNGGWGSNGNKGSVGRDAWENAGVCHNVCGGNGGDGGNGGTGIVGSVVVYGGSVSSANGPAGTVGIDFYDQGRLPLCDCGFSDCLARGDGIAGASGVAL